MTPLPSGLSTRPESFAPTGESTLRLQRAIESLALNLDDELHRYRQNRSGQGAIPAPARLQLRPNRKPIDLIALKTAAAAPATPPPPPPNARLQELLGQASVPSTQAYPPKTTVNQVRLSHGGTLTTYRPSPEEYLESTEALLGSHPSRPPAGKGGDENPPSLIRQLTSPLGMGALLLLLVGSASFGYLVTSPEAISHLSDNPIARRLKGAPADGTASDAQSNSASQGESGFKPLGPDLSEQEFSSIDLDDISTLPSANSPTPVQNVPVQTQLGETPGAESGAEGVGPEGAVSDLRAAGAVPSAPRPGVLTPAGGRSNSAVVRANIVAAPRPAATTQPSAVRSAPAPSRPAPTAPATPPPAVRVAPPAANAQPPQPLSRNRAPSAPPAAPPAVAPPAPITQAPPQSAPNYYVVTDYNGASSLESARGAVGDAYVRDFSGGTRIQMGAFSQESSARNLQQQLESQGIPAQVISP
ncbi:SPOR domain-containing protein [Nodosilinea sp. AN01ver1]|uniref:SPOR domain-containing protein n=1 Tax=Nodosilinea sp. AN01ver1 TaxID=3423362 RepID=UPI003D3225B0